MKKLIQLSIYLLCVAKISFSAHHLSELDILKAQRSFLQKAIDSQLAQLISSEKIKPTNQELIEANAEFLILFNDRDRLDKQIEELKKAKK